MIIRSMYEIQIGSSNAPTLQMPAPVPNAPQLVVCVAAIKGYTGQPTPQPIYGKNYADVTYPDTVTPQQIATALRDTVNDYPANLQNIVSKTADALAADVPDYRETYDGTEFVVVVPATVDLSGSHTFAGWSLPKPATAKRTIYTVAPTAPITQAETLPEEFEVWVEGANTYADYLAPPTESTFRTVLRLVTAMAGQPAATQLLMWDVAMSLLNNVPIFEQDRVGETFTTLIPPPLGFVMDYVWTGWPVVNG